MSIPGEKDGERSLRQRGSSECKPLIDAATKDLFRKNAFRITGLSVDATTREIAKHADKIKMLAELGQDPHTQGAAIPMKPPPSLDEIREAIQKLRDPEKRLIDEFFWFWPGEFGNDQSDLAFQALAKGDFKAATTIWASRENDEDSGITATHNNALIYHIWALDWESYAVENDVEAERPQAIIDYWQGAFSRWKRLVINERYWEKVTARIRQLNEPNLPTGFARRMRATLPEALAKINADVALAFAESGRIELGRPHIRFMREINQGLDNFEKTAELVLKATRSRLNDQIQRAQGRAKKNPHDAASAARELLQQAQSALALYDLFFGKDSDLRNERFDEVASLCNFFQVAYHKATSDEKTCLDILNSVLPLANAVELRQQIEENIGKLKSFIADKQIEPVYLLLKSIQNSKEMPAARLAQFERDAVSAIAKATGASGFSLNYGYLSVVSGDCKGVFESAAQVLRGISLDAWNNHQDRRTAVAANELAVKHAISPELKKRLAEDKTVLQPIKKQTPAASAPSSAKRAKPNITGKIVLGAVAGIIVLGIIGSCNPTTAPSNNNSYTPPVLPGAPAYRPPPPAVDANSDGNVYRVPSAVSTTLDVERAQIESERTQLEALKNQVDALGREIENDRVYLDRTSQYAVNAFNEKVGNYNEIAQRSKFANAAFNERVANYNAKLQQYGR